MEDAHAVLGHHVQLGVLDGDDVLLVERLSAPGAVINYTRGHRRAGHRRPRHHPRAGDPGALTGPDGAKPGHHLIAA
jgi:hypothetical protein